MLSIVTVTYNDADRLKETLESVSTQKNQNFEYIIVDGASKDGTGSLIQVYKQKMNLTALSERDEGLYDAMNKGAKLAKGKYILFLNSGDLLLDPECVDRLNQDISSPQCQNADGFYADVIVQREDGSRWKRKAHSFRCIYRGLPSSHQALLVKREHCLIFPFIKSFRLTADFCMGLRIYNAGHKSWIKLIHPFSVVTTGGISDVHRTKARKEFLKTLWRFGTWSQFLLGVPYHSIMIALNGITSMLKQILGKRFYLSLKSLLLQPEIGHGNSKNEN